MLQDVGVWTKEGLVDRVLPMIYTDNNADYARDLDAWIAAGGKKPITPGIGAYKHPQPSQTLDQIRLSDRADGYCLFAYATIFESVNPFEAKDDTAMALRTARRRSLEPLQVASHPDRSAP